MSLEPGRLCKVSSKGRKSFDALHSKAALDWGSRALCTYTASRLTSRVKQFRLEESEHPEALRREGNNEM
jgi:hypothetical protein